MNNTGKVIKENKLNPDHLNQGATSDFSVCKGLQTDLAGGGRDNYLRCV